MKNNSLFTAGLVLTILGLIGVITKFRSSSYTVLVLGLVLLIIYYFSKTRK
jgi:predicted membrane protein